MADHFGEAQGVKEQCDEHHKRKIDAAASSSVPHSWLRVWIERDRNIDAAKIWRVLRVLRVRDDGATVYRCAALGPAGCLIERDERPSMCNGFPYGGTPGCHACGSFSDAEARGVALARIA